VLSPLLLLLSSGCSTFKNIIPLEIRTVEVERKIPIQKRPRPITLNNIYFYVVTEDTFEEFKKRFEKENGDFLFYAISVRDYETLALNMAELKRFLQQQKQLIIYYEKAVTPKAKKKLQPLSG
jgi:leucyl aminopeptidase (aminopeptidase T)